MTDAIKKRGGLNIAIRNVSFNENAKNNLGLHSTGKGGSSINFKASAWNKMNEAEKYTLFMHEVGHGLLWQPEKDKDVYGIMGDGPYGVSKKLMSSKQEYNRLLDHHFSTRGNKGVTAIARTSPGKGTDQFDPSWFPQLSGEQVKIDGGNYSPGTGGKAGTLGMPDTQAIFAAGIANLESSSNDAGGVLASG
jgi:hypothetical protein